VRARWSALVVVVAALAAAAALGSPIAVLDACRERFK
jgi:hypothetical protein